MPGEAKSWSYRAGGAGRGEDRGVAGFYRAVWGIVAGEPLKKPRNKPYSPVFQLSRRPRAQHLPQYDSSSTVGVHQVSVSYPMRGDVKIKILPCSPERGGCLACIQPDVDCSEGCRRAVSLLEHDHGS